MKKTLAALALGLISNTALANSGNINFVGSITAGGTCPIEVVEPGSGGSVLPRVVVGSYHPEYFSTTGTTTREIPFAMRVTPVGGCTILPGQSGYVTFTPIYGPSGSDLYALRPGSARNLALALQDSSFSNLAPGTESVGYELDEVKPTEMLFYAMYQSTDTTVGTGDAQTEVTFTVDIK